jgi:hypothetical protein
MFDGISCDDEVFVVKVGEMKMWGTWKMAGFKWGFSLQKTRSFVS